MAELREETVQRLTDALENLSRTQGSSPNAERFDSRRFKEFDTTLDTSRQTFGKAAESVSEAFIKMASGTAGAADAFNLAALTMKQFGTVAGTVGDIFNQLGRGAIAVNEALKETGRYGVTFGNDLGTANLAIKNAHLTLGEFADIVGQGSQSMAGLGSTMDKSAKAYLSVVESVTTSDVGRDLRAMGVSSRELAEITQLSLSRKRLSDFEEGKAKEAVVEAATRMAAEFTQVSEITGKNRRQLLDEQKKAMESTEVLAATLRYGSQFKQNLDAATQGLSPALKRAVMEQATGGIRTEEGMNIAVSLGPAMSEVNKLVAAMKSGDVDKIKEAQEELQGATIRQMKEQAGATMILGDTYAAHGKILQENMGYAEAVMEKQAEMEKTGVKISEAEALRMLKAEGALKREGKDAEGKIAEGAVTGRAINQIDYLGKVAGSVAAEGLKQLNDKLGNVAKTAIPDFEIALKRFATGQQAINEAQKAGEDLVKSVTEGIKGAGWSPTATEKETQKAIPKRESGSFGATGEFFENFGKGTLVELHGKESVLTEEQFIKLAKYFPGVSQQDFLKSEMMVPGYMKNMTDTLSSLGVTGFGTPSMNKADKLNSDAMSEIIRFAIAQPNTNTDSKKVFSKEDVEKAAVGLNKSVLNESNKTIKPIDPIASLGKDMPNVLRNWQANLTTELAKPLEAKKEETQQPSPTTTEKPSEIQQTSDSATTKDVKDELVRLNTSIRELISQTTNVVDGISQQVRATKSLSGNRIG